MFPFGNLVLQWYANVAGGFMISKAQVNEIIYKDNPPLQIDDIDYWQLGRNSA